MNWNKPQRKAIEERGKNLLVAAAAGSGKTAVLIERIKRLIIEEKVPLNKFLVVTFTKAAASEMKEKIRNALTETIEKSEDKEEILYMKKQLDMVDRVNISTFHSFAFEIVKRYFYLTDLEPNFKISDEAESTILKEEAIDAVFSMYFEEKNEEFIDFITCYSSDRNEKKAKEMVLLTYKMIQSISKPFQWLEEKVNDLNMSSADFSKSDLFEFIKTDTENTLKFVKESVDEMLEILSTAGIESIVEKFDTFCDKLEKADVNGKDYDSLVSFMQNMRFPQMRASKEEKGAYDWVKEEVVFIRDRAKKQLEDTKNRYFLRSIDEYIGDINKTYKYGTILKNMVIDFHNKFKELKREKLIVDFNDIEHYALEILENEKVSEEYRKKFDYIFIDEYQDSNDVQDTLVSKIKRENNLFMVGDVKQSIYKFRLAEPELFVEKYREYSKHSKSMKIDLNQNFRSKTYVIETVNHIFEKVMEGYDENAALHKGVSYSGELDLPSKLIIFDEKNEDENVDEAIMEMRKAEKEAHVVAEEIKKVLGQKIYDAKKDFVREIEKRDIVILMRSIKTNGEIYAQALENENIPVYIDDSDGYFDTIEVSLAENILSIIDNTMQDVPLIGVMYSPIFGFTIDELTQIRLAGQELSFYRAFKKYKEGCFSKELEEKCAFVDETISSWKQLARDVPLNELVWKVLWDTGYYTYVGALPAGSRRQANLRALADKAQDALDGGIYDVYGFLKYIKAVKEKKVAVGQMKTVGESEDVVRIMTVHKSKGLEFPVVIASSLGSKFNLRSSNADLNLHRKMGIALTYINSKEHWKRKTLLQNAIEKCIRNESYEEEKRVLYVELTRAMDRLIMVGSVKDFEKSEYKYKILNAMNAVTPLELISPVIFEGQNHTQTEILDVTDIAVKQKNKEENKESIRQIIDDKRKSGNGDIERRLSFIYPNLEDAKTKYKYSVTELAHESFEKDKQKDICLNVPNFMRSKEEFTVAEVGTITHRIMEYIDFKEENLQKIIEQLVEKNIITEEEAKVVNVEGIKSFIGSNIGKRAAKSKSLKREQPFTVLKEMHGTEIMVQGVIDCYFEEDGQLVLIDYKNSMVKSEDILKERYREQISIYKEALESTTGKKVKESYLYLLSEGKTVEM